MDPIHDMVKAPEVHARREPALSLRALRPSRAARVQPSVPIAAPTSDPGFPGEPGRSRIQRSSFGAATPSALASAPKEGSSRIVRRTPVPIRESDDPLVIRRQLGTQGPAAVGKSVVHASGQTYRVTAVAAGQGGATTYDLTGAGGPVPGVTDTDAAYDWAWSKSWGAAVTALDQGNGLLGPANALAHIWNTFPAAVAHRHTFVQALLDPIAPASIARAALTQMRNAMVPQGKDPRASKMPTTMNNDLLEYVSAKLLYERGDVSLQPGVPLQGDTTMYPDYSIRGLSATTDVGDHVRVASGKNAAEVGAQVCNGVVSKLGTYDAQVRVVVDISSAPGISEGTTTLDAVRGEAITALTGKLPQLQYRNRMISVDLVAGSEHRTISRNEVGL